MKCVQPLRPEDKRDIDITMETEKRTAGFGLRTQQYESIFHQEWVVFLICVDETIRL